MGGAFPELTPVLDDLYQLASALDGRSRAVPVVYEPLTARHFGGVLLVAGEIDMDNAADLAASLVPLVARGGDVRVNMAAVTFMGWCGVHVLTEVAAALGAAGRLVLVAPSHPVRRVIDLLGVPDNIVIDDGDGHLGPPRPDRR